MAHWLWESQNDSDRTRVRVADGLYSLGAAALLWGAWEIAVAIGLLDGVLFPPPSRFVRYAIDEGFQLGIGADRSGILISALLSIARVAAGMGAAIAAGLAIGLLAAAFRPFSRLILPLLRLLAPISPVAWVPLGIVLFGIGNTAAVFIVFLGTVFVFAIAVLAAIENRDRYLIRTAVTLGASGSVLWTRVIGPAALPELLAALRLSFFGGWTAVLAAEMVGLRSGLGAMIMIGRESFNPNLILVGMTMVAICGVAIDGALRYVQRRFFWWSAWWVR
jgi:NitT/TauT family transport system permease protein